MGAAEWYWFFRSTQPLQHYFSLTFVQAFISSKVGVNIVREEEEVKHNFIVGGRPGHWPRRLQSRAFTSTFSDTCLKVIQAQKQNSSNERSIINVELRSWQQAMQCGLIKLQLIQNESWKELRSSSTLPSQEPAINGSILKVFTKINYYY